MFNSTIQHIIYLKLPNALYPHCIFCCLIRDVAHPDSDRDGSALRSAQRAGWFPARLADGESSHPVFD